MVKMNRAHKHEWKPAASTFGQARYVCSICGFGVPATVVERVVRVEGNRWVLVER